MKSISFDLCRSFINPANVITKTVVRGKKTNLEDTTLVKNEEAVQTAIVKLDDSINLDSSNNLILSTDSVLHDEIKTDSAIHFVSRSAAKLFDSSRNIKIIQSTEPAIPIIRSCLGETSIPDELFQTEQQFSIISKLKENIDFEGMNEIKQHLLRKLYSYEQQDKQKLRFAKTEDEHFATLSELLNLFIDSSMNCYYCSTQMLIAYKEVRDMNQWTLDRIDNTKIHSADNCRVACLRCNLQKRRRDDASFLFTKRLRINRKNIESESDNSNSSSEKEEDN